MSATGGHALPALRESADSGSGLDSSAGLDVCASPSVVQLVAKYLPAGAGLHIDDIHALYDFDERSDVQGEGSQARVFKARERSSGETVAIKALTMERLDTRKRWTRVAREIDVLYTMRHPNIMALKAVLYTDANIYLVSEFLAGGELFNFILAKGYFPEDEVRHMLRQLVSAVAFLHQHRVTHRDLKPENILLVEQCRYPTLKIVDFGYCKRMTRAELLHSAVGSPMYAAPEVFHHMPYGLDVDMFSIGVITFILLCGYPPFDADTDAGIIAAAADFDPALAFDADEWDDISPEAKDVVVRCLKPPSRERISAVEFLAHPWLAAAPAPASSGLAEAARRDRLAESSPDVRTSFLALPVVDALRAFDAVRPADDDDDDDTVSSSEEE